MSLYPKRSRHEFDTAFWAVVCDTWPAEERLRLGNEASKMQVKTDTHCVQCFGVGSAHASWCTYKHGPPECPNCLRVEGHDRYCPRYSEGKGVYDQDDDDPAYD